MSRTSFRLSCCGKLIDLAPPQNLKGEKARSLTTFGPLLWWELCCGKGWSSPVGNSVPKAGDVLHEGFPEDNIRQRVRLAGDCIFAH